MRDGELFGVHAVGAGVFERRHAPIHRTLEGWSSGNTPTDFVAQSTKIRFQGGRLECFRNQTIRGFSIRMRIGGESKKKTKDEEKEMESQPPEFASHSAN